MQRIVCPERDDWQATAESAGFDFHTIDGERYWDERACYAFTLDEIESQIEAPTAEIDAMCLELVGRAVDDDEVLRRLRIPEAFWPKSYKYFPVVGSEIFFTEMTVLT